MLKFGREETFFVFIITTSNFYLYNDDVAVILELISLHKLNGIEPVNVPTGRKRSFVLIKILLSPTMVLDSFFSIKEWKSCLKKGFNINKCTYLREFSILLAFKVLLLHCVYCLLRKHRLMKEKKIKTKLNEVLDVR